MRVALAPAPGIVADDTEFSTPGWRASSGGRFWRDSFETVGGWEALSLTLLTGVCRTVFEWSDQDNRQTFAFGMHNGLTVIQNETQASITPVSISATGTITSTGAAVDGETFVVGTQTFTFKTSRSAPYQVTISGTVATQATNIATAINTDIPTVVTAAAALGVVTLTAPAGYAGNLIALSEAATNVTVSGPKLTGGSGFLTGQIDGTGGSGYGTGAYGTGGYGEPSTTDNFPLTWSFGVRFGALYANPRGQGIFRWENNTGTPAAILSNAPAVCNSILSVYTGQIMALGCTDQDGTFNPACIRISDINIPTTWTVATNSTAQQYYLEGNGRIIGGRQVGQTAFIWTESELHAGAFGTSWDFDRIGTGGLCGPNAAVVLGQTAYWVSPDRQFYGCPIGGTPSLLLSNDGRPCPIRQEFADNAAASQNDKIVAAAYAARGEIVWFYADKRDGNGVEISRAVRFSTLDGAWAFDELARTAYVDAVPSPVGVTYSGQIYWHERGNSADGAARSWYVETGAQYIEPGERHVMTREWRPDFKDQIGPVTLEVWTRNYPQGPESYHGPYVAAPGASKVDVRFSGMLGRFRFSGNSSPSYARFGKQTLDFAPTGER